MSENEATQPRQGGDQSAEPLTEEGLTEELEQVAEERMRQVNDEITRERQQGPDDAGR